MSTNQEIFGFKKITSQMGIFKEQTREAFHRMSDKKIFAQIVFDGKVFAQIVCDDNGVIPEEKLKDGAKKVAALINGTVIKIDPKDENSEYINIIDDKLPSFLKRVCVKYPDKNPHWHTMFVSSGKFIIGNATNN